MKRELKKRRARHDFNDDAAGSYEKRLGQSVQRYREAPHIGSGKQIWWWITGNVMKYGKIRAVLFGPEPDEASAHRRGYEIFKGGDFEVKSFPTRVVSVATQMWKAQKAKTSPIEDAMENVRHTGKDIGIEGGIRR